MSKDRIKYFLIDNVFPNLYAFSAQKKIERKIELLRQEGLNLVFPNNKDLDLDAFSEELEDYQDKENDRKKVIDDKAKSALFVITLSTTVMLAGLNFIKDGTVTFGLPLLLLVLLGVLYLILSGVTAVKALNVRQFFTLHPDDWLEQDQRTVAGLQMRARIKKLYAAIKVNELALLIKSNFVDATLTGIRNGIILLSTAFIIAVGNVGNQVRYIAPVKNETSGSSGAGSSSKQDQSPTPPAQVTPTQANIVSNNNQPEAAVPNDKPSTENKQNINSSGEKRAKNPQAGGKNFKQ